MGIVTLIFNFIISIPKIWAIFREIVDWIETRKKEVTKHKNEKAREQIKTGKTKKEKEDAADRYLDTLD